MLDRQTDLWQLPTLASFGYAGVAPQPAYLAGSTVLLGERFAPFRVVFPPDVTRRTSPLAVKPRIEIAERWSAAEPSENGPNRKRGREERQLENGASPRSATLGRRSRIASNRRHQPFPNRSPRNNPPHVSSSRSRWVATLEHNPRASEIKPSVADAGGDRAGMFWACEPAANCKTQSPSEASSLGS
jgi:hypothetical protein